MLLKMKTKTEEVLKEMKMRLNAKESFTEMGEDGKMMNWLGGGQMMKLDSPMLENHNDLNKATMLENRNDLNRARSHEKILLES